jgi:opacity protein-like surface antigen
VKRNGRRSSIDWRDPVRCVLWQIFVLGLVLLASPVTAATAQEQAPAGEVPSEVRVVKDRATIWSRNPSMVLAIVPAGTVLRAVSRQDRWIEVVIPAKAGGKGGTGFVLAAHVEHVPGTPEIPLRSTSQSNSIWREPTPGTEKQPAIPPPAIGVRGFGSASYSWFQASDSFNAIFGSSWQPFFGAGGQVVFGDRLFVEASWEQFKKTGERVVVSDGEVFPLGIDDEVTVNPILVTAGYRFRTTRSMVSFVGGGVGSYRYREVSEFADSSENVDERHVGYHVRGGVEYGLSKWILAAFEVQYASVPDALGAPGVSGEFNETNLGGVGFRFKLLAGR